jgi:hypothetical protein
VLWLDHDPSSNEKICKDIPGYVGMIETRDGSALQFDFSNVDHENQMDVYCFKSVEAIKQFMMRPENIKLAYCPSSVFRIISNRRLFIGEDGLCSFLDNSSSPWGFAYPFTMIFYGGVPTGLEFIDTRPNTVKSTASRDCVAFASFGSIFPSIRNPRETSSGDSSGVGDSSGGSSAGSQSAPPLQAAAAPSSRK